MLHETSAKPAPGEKLQKVNFLIKFCKCLLTPTEHVYHGGKDNSVSLAKGFCLGTMDYIAAKDAWVISVEPIPFLHPFELDVGPR